MAGEGSTTTADADATSTCSPSTPADGTTAPCAAPKERRFIELHWMVPDGWCSEDVPIAGTTQNYADGETVSISVKALVDGHQVTSFTEAAHSDAFTHNWKMLEILPGRGSGYVEFMNCNGHAEGQTTPVPVKLNFIPNLPKTHYSVDRAHFDLTSEDYLLKIESEIKYVPGWGGEVVKLGGSVPAATGGLLDGQLTWSGYRWMKSSGLGKVYWDGGAWQALPAGFTLIDANNFSVGFYQSGTSYVCQYGGTWPESFTAWDVTTAANQQVINRWIENIRTVWTNKFDIERIECRSAAEPCCRYATKADVVFTREAAFAAGMLIIADGNIRSNDSLWFLGEPRVAVAAHEFGHHLGNPDEYAGAVLDTSLNTDGATAGIDPNSIMGQNLTTVKVRHYRTICTHMAAMVQTKTGKSYTYRAVPVGRSLGAPGGSGSGGGAGGSAAGTILGAVIGAIVGALIGAAIGALAGGSPTAIVTGAIVGGLAGAAAGAAIGSRF